MANTNINILTNALIEKLGWGDMLTHIALPAIEDICKSVAYVNSEMYGISMESQLEEDGEFHDTFCRDVLRMPALSLFAFLVTRCDDMFIRECLREAYNIRGEFEEAMRNGHNHKELLEIYL